MFFALWDNPVVQHYIRKNYFSLHFLVYLCKTLETKSELLCSLQFGQRGSKALEYVFLSCSGPVQKKKSVYSCALVICYRLNR